MSFSVSCRSRLLGLLLIALPVALASDSVAQQPTSPERVSEFGKYEGYTQAEFEHWVVSSQYIEMRDGVKLAIDIVRPSADGEEPAPGPFPVLWTHSRYHRNPKAMNPQVESMVDAQSDLQRLVKHGYAVASVGVRGSGASFGRFEGLFSPNETRDAFDVMEWLVQQS